MQGGVERVLLLELVFTGLLNTKVPPILRTLLRMSLVSPQTLLSTSPANSAPAIAQGGQIAPDRSPTCEEWGWIAKGCGAQRQWWWIGGYSREEK